MEKKVPRLATATIIAIDQAEDELDWLIAFLLFLNFVIYMTLFVGLMGLAGIKGLL